jgi:hypothetical protein
VRYEKADEIADAIKNRDDWYRRQETFYKMRHFGLKRIASPYPGAADLHFPLIDSLIERLKPFYYSQLYGKDQFATFTSLKTQPEDTTSAVGAWFDYRLKQKTNLERKILSCVDAMCMAGRSVLKTIWDFDRKVICFYNVAPYYFVVDPSVDNLAEDANWCVHIMSMSEATYKKNENFRQDKEFIAKIKGRNVGDYGIAGTNAMYQTIRLREGITIPENEESILLYEIYCKEKDGRIYYETFSPKCMQEEDAVREREYLPYDHKKFPFISFRSEIKDEGWYSPRGVAEIVASFEDSLTRQWNFKHDWMDFFNRPLFKRTPGSLGTGQNTSNTKFLPGSTLPDGVEPVESKAPPLSFDQEMQTTRALAEYRINVPDLGASEHLAGRPGAKGDVTATQVNAIVGQSQLTDDMRSRVFRLDLGDMFKMCWSLYRQFDSQSLTYVLYDTVGQLPPDALQGEYEIMPNGSAESWNKPQQLQKAIARLQMFRGSPYWRQDELEKSVMELDDPRMIKRAFTDPGQELKKQMEVQAQEISIMLLGFPAAVQPSDDDKAHIQSMEGFVQRDVQTGEGRVTPEVARLILQHGADHDNALAQKGDKNINQVRQQMQPMIEYLSQVANSQPLPSNVVPGPGTEAGGPGLAAGGGQAPGGAMPSEDPIGDATKVMNALATLKKAGVPITDEEVNKALTNAGLPPLQAGMPIPPEPVPEQPKKSFSIKRSDGGVSEISEGAS